MSFAAFTFAPPRSVRRPAVCFGWFVAVWGIQMACSSAALARCGLLPADAFRVDVAAVTGFDAADLLLMPPCRYVYERGQVSFEFGSIPQPCSGPQCRAPQDAPPAQNGLLAETERSNSVDPAATAADAAPEPPRLEGSLATPPSLYASVFHTPAQRPPNSSAFSPRA